MKIKKLVTLLFAAFFCLSFVTAQNLADNEYQKAGMEYERQANEALNTGDYSKASELANLASIEYAKSRDFALEQNRKFRAANGITVAQNNITEASAGTGAKKFAKELAAANTLLASAKELFAAGNWTESRAKADESILITKALLLLPVTPVPVTQVSVQDDRAMPFLPKFYIVVSRPVNTDSFWNIAKMPEVYGNPHLWIRLYQANKMKLRNPENPNLIHPGQIFEIPPYKNEKREGTYQSGKIYPKLEK